MAAHSREMTGKVALVVGCGVPGGSGAAAARALCEAGAHVVLADLPRSRVEEVTADLVRDGHSASCTTVDLLNPVSAAAVIDFCIATYGRIDGVANVAAATHLVHRDRGVSDMDLAVWDETFGVNVRGAMLVCKAALPVMIAAGGGAIVNISSGQGLRGDLQNTAYSASKAALDSLTRSIAAIYGDVGIRCNSIASGVIATSLMKSIFPEQMKQVVIEATPLGRLGEPEDIANLVVFLLSDRAAFITAQTIQCDGGILDTVPTRSGLRRIASESERYLSANER